MEGIVIAGDWVVDEYWYLVKHHSEISSHTGFVHYRSSSEPTERVIDLCSAGRVARVIYSLKYEDKDSYNIWGIGDWNENDTEHLLHLVHTHIVNDCDASLANFTLGRRFCKKPPAGIQLFPLHKNRQTTRAVRLYQTSGSGIDQISRVDWELIENPNQKSNAINLPKSLPQKNEIKSIIIHDLCKGAVTDELIYKLDKKYPDAQWYIRTKSRNPAWLETISKKVKLLLIGPEVAEPDNPWGSWLRGTKISFQSLNLLNSIEVDAAIVLTDNREVIGRIKEENNCITAKAPFIPEAASLQVGWPSAFMAVLVHYLHKENKPLSKEMVQKALKKADEYADLPVGRLSKNRTFIPEIPSVHKSSWSSQANEWHDALKDKGIINPKSNDVDGESYIEVWRGSSDLPGYVACIEGKRQLIIDIGKRLRAFANEDVPTRSISFLLQADPGSGKSHLAKLLAHQLNFSLLPFDVTQMLHRDDLLDLFDAVATEQANHPDRRVLVLVDEINAYLDAASVYSAFLAPLEQGVYVRRGRVFSLKPCVWVFAGTGLESSIKNAKSEKISDFQQRLTATVKLDYKSLKEAVHENHKKDQVRKMAKLEQVYLGVTMIQKRYPDVNRVGYSLIKKFYEYDPEESPAREIRKVVEELRNVQYGMVSLWNVSPENKPNKDFIRLIS